MSIKMTHDQFVKRVFDEVGNEYTVIGEYKDSTKKVTMRHNCAKCNNYEYDVKPQNFLSEKNRCPKCFGNKKRTIESYKQEVQLKRNGEYTILGDTYTNNKTPILTRHNCNLCNNYEWEIAPVHLLAGRSCPICANLAKCKSHSRFVQQVKNLVGDEYTVVGTYKDNNTKIRMRHNCSSCNNYEWDIQPSSFIKPNGNRCPKCNNLGMTKTTNNYKQEVYDLVGDEYTVVDEYVNAHTPITMRHNCDKCNNYEWKVSPINFKGGQRCKKCNGKSQSQIDITEFILQYFDSKDVLTDNRSILKDMELDIVVTSANIAFEYDGLFWHSDCNIPNKRYHLDKTEAANRQGIRLIHIFEDEWLYKEDIVKSKIRHILGKNDNPKIYARKCVIKELKTSKEIKLKGEFLEKNHIQGNDKSCIKLGLYYEGKLVSVMTFCKPRESLGQTNSKYDYELSRFASDINYNVIGAFSKLFKYFERNYKWNKIITYADKRWSVGDVYLKNGWSHLHDSKPNYWYSNNQMRYHRYNFRKSVLSEKFPDIYDKNLTEFSIMDKTKYTRIWDCGNMVFEYVRQ